MVMNSSPLDNFYHWEKTTPQTLFFQQPVGGQWHNYSYERAGREIRSLAAALQSLNLPPTSNIAILSKNCAHWIMADLAIWMAGYVSVPLYPNLTAPSIRQILEHSEAKAIFLGKLDDYSSQRPGIPDHLHKISFALYGPGDGLGWDDLLKKNEALKGNKERNPDELVTIMYTSGTTGLPKGVMFSFRQMMWPANAAVGQLQNHFGFPLHARLFSYLPLCHIAERMITELAGLIVGSTITFADSLETFAANLSHTQPHLFFGVPRIYAKFQEKILEKLPQRRLNFLLKTPLVGSLLKKTIKKNLGLREAKVIGVGAAPVPASLLQWYASLGITVRDIYGMTENSGFCTFNLASIKTGSVGQPWPGVEIKLSKEGEIMTRHPGTMMGYYKEPAMTAALFNDDGFLKTGDIGEFDENGFLTITGRIKDIFKTDKGKYVAPAPIEMHLLANKDIEHVCVVGNGIPQPIALVVLSVQGMTRSKEDIIKSLSSSLAEVNQRLESYEKLETAVVMKADWTVENGLMTPTLKVKRNEVEKIHVQKYPGWYHEKGIVVWE
jgi:long-chain acyl-CoA synthetase